MKKVLLSIALLTIINSVKSQETNLALTKGTWSVETSLSPFSLINTSGFSFKNNKKNSEWTVGGEAGYFIQDKLALKAGLGLYGYKNQIEENAYITESSLSYKIGAKY